MIFDYKIVKLKQLEIINHLIILKVLKYKIIYQEFKLVIIIYNYLIFEIYDLSLVVNDILVLNHLKFMIKINYYLYNRKINKV